MKLSRKKHKRLAALLKSKSYPEIARNLHVSEQDLSTYVEEHYDEFESNIAQNNNLQVILEEPSSANKLIGFITNSWVISIVLIFLSFAVYYTSLGNDFISDDVTIFEKTNTLQSYETMDKSFPYIGRNIVLSTVVQLSGNSPYWLRVSNVAFHAGAVVMIYFLGIILLGKKSLAFIAASIFAVHPMMTESVVWITGGAYAQYSFLTLLSLYLFILYDKKSRWFYLVLSVLVALLAFAGNERAVVIPLLILLYIVCFSTFKKHWKPFVLFGGLLVAFTAYVYPMFSSRIEEYQKVIFTGQESVDPVIIPAAIGRYMYMLVVPLRQTFYHTNWNLNGPYLLLYIGLILGIGYALYYLWKRAKHVFFWLAFFLIALSPMMLPFSVYAWGAERYVYLASVGFIMLFVLMLNYFAEKTGEYKYTILVTVTISIVVVFSFLTIQRTGDWKNETTFVEAAARVSSGTELTHNNLGLQHYKNEKYPEAIEEFEKTLEINPDFADAHLNLATVYKTVGEIEKAVESYEKAIQIHPECWECLFDLSVIYFEQQDMMNALLYLEQAVEIQPNEPQMLNNLATLYLQMGDIEKAKPLLERSLKLAPEDENVMQLYESLSE